MFLSDVSIKRPVFATMLNLVLVVFGLYALPKLAVEQYPNVDFPFVTVQVIYPGADPESIEKRVLEPLEKAVNGISGLEKLSSTAYPNLGFVMLQFSLEKNGDQAAQEVRDKVFAAVSLLPDEAETPVVQKFDIGGAPIMSLSLTAKGMSVGELSKLAKDVIQPRVQRIKGIARVDLAGNREREVHVLLNRELLSSYGLTPMDIVGAIKQQNVDAPSGKIENDTQYFSLRVHDIASGANEIGALPISVPQRGLILKMSDVAKVVDTVAEEKTAAFVNQEPTILFAIYKQSGGNTNSIAEETRKAIDRLTKELPENVSLHVVVDNSKFIKGSIDAVKLDLFLGAILAIVIVLLFLRDWRATLISAVALPTSVIGTFAFISYMGFTLNMMSTLALSLSIGILIDDAIVVIENIYRHMHEGKSPFQAAKDAASEIGLAVFATSLTICAVFVPVAFMRGIIGRFFYQFGMTVAAAVLISLFVAFTLTPMLSSRYLKSEGHGEPKNPLLRQFWFFVENALSWIDRNYSRLLGWCLSHRGLTLTFGVVTFILSAVMLKFVPVAFFPKEDRSQLMISYTLPENTRLEVTKARSLELAKAVQSYPGVRDVIAAVGADSSNRPNFARFDVMLVPPHDRRYSQAEFMNRLREDLTKPFTQDGSKMSVSDISNGGGPRSEKIQLILKGQNRESVQAFSRQVADYLKSNVKGTVDVSTTEPDPQREFKIEVDPRRAADVGLSSGQVAMAMRTLFEGEKVGEIQDVSGRYDLRVKMDDANRKDIQDIASVSLMSMKGRQLMLGSVAQIIDSTAPAAIERYDGQNQITVLANFTGKDLGAAIEQIEQYVRKNAPAGVTLSLQGEAEIMKDSMIAMLLALMLAVVLIYMILCAQYESYLSPMVIMMALPLSFTGAFGALLLTGSTMSVYTMIGIILLMGIVTKNGILLIDFALQRIHAGHPMHDALKEAGLIRLRPILMTTFAAGFGMLPVALGHGEGGEAKSPMGIVVIGGLMMSTLLTLIVVPCFFSVMQGMKNRLSRHS